MKSLLKSVKTLLLGGILFFIPLIILILILEKAFKLANVLLGPIVSFLEGKSLFGLGLEIIISIAVIVFVILLGGIISRMAIARYSINRIENAVLSKVPGYNIIKSIIDNIGMIEKEEDSLKVVIAEVDDGWKFGFLSEELDDGKSAVFLPDAPNPWSGSLVYLAPEQITRTDIPITSVMKYLRTLGKGSNEWLKEYFPGVPKRAVDSEGAP